MIPGQLDDESDGRGFGARDRYDTSAAHLDPSSDRRRRSCHDALCHGGEVHLIVRKKHERRQL